MKRTGTMTKDNSPQTGHMENQNRMTDALPVALASGTAQGECFS